LILPHPRLQDRAFVLVPLADIAADWCHPVSGVSVRRMVDALPPSDVEAVRPL
jgi:2-amino-4-hydroxy-6-hydroxymethyldihydropteridine diphosphokinase